VAGVVGHVLILQLVPFIDHYPEVLEPDFYVFKNRIKKSGFIVPKKLLAVPKKNAILFLS
jgi:hypothetical protein